MGIVDIITELSKPNRYLVLTLKDSDFYAFFDMDDDGKVTDFGLTTLISRAAKFKTLSDAFEYKEAIEDLCYLTFEPYIVQVR